LVLHKIISIEKRKSRMINDLRDFGLVGVTELVTILWNLQFMQA